MWSGGAPAGGGAGPQEGGRGRRGGLGPRRRRLGPVGRLDVQRRLLRGGSAGLDEGEHVLLAHAPAAARALDLLEVDAVLGGDALDDGGVALGAARRRLARRGGLGARWL